MRKPPRSLCNEKVGLIHNLAGCLFAGGLAVSLWAEAAPIHFTHRPLPVTLETSEKTEGLRYTPATMAGGVAVFDYDHDGDFDIYLTNGAAIPSLKKTSPKFWNRLLANDGHANFTDVTAAAGLAGTGYDTGVSVADYDNDGDQDVFLAGVHRNSLYRNDGHGSFTEVTETAGLARPDPEHDPLWAVSAVWLDYDNDSWLDLFVVNYLRWSVDREKPCVGYCHPVHYEGLPNRLYHNNADGTFTDVSAASGIRQHIGKGMGAAAADYDLDGLPDIFVSNDKIFNFFFHNLGQGKFEEIAFDAGVALAEHATEISGMGVDFRDFDNDGWPDIALVALDNETFPLFRNTGKGDFVEITNRSGLAHQAMSMAGYGPGLVDFDADGWKDLFVSCGHVQSEDMRERWNIEFYNAVFRNLGNGKVKAYVKEAGLAAAPPKRHRGAAFGDLNGDGRIDAVVSAINRRAELWLNDSPGANHWLALKLRGTRSNRDAVGARVKVVTAAGAQYNHVAANSGYASSSVTPLYFGLGESEKAGLVEIHWPSGAVQRVEKVVSGQVLEITEPNN